MSLNKLGNDVILSLFLTIFFTKNIYLSQFLIPTFSLSILYIFRTHFHFNFHLTKKNKSIKIKYQQIVIKQ